MEYLEPGGVQVHAMLGRSSTWTRVDLEHVPEPLRPEQEPFDPDHDWWRRLSRDPGETPRRARREE